MQDQNPLNGGNFTPHISPEVQGLIPAAHMTNKALELIQALTVRDQNERIAAKGTYDDAKRAHKRLDDARLEIGRETNDFRDRLLTRIGITPALAYYKQVIGIVEGKMRTYDADVERLRREEEARLQAKAREESDRLRREASERQRKADEAAAKLRAEAERNRQAQAAAAQKKVEAEAANDAQAKKIAEREEIDARRRAEILDGRANRKIGAAAEKAQELTMKADMVPVPVIESQDDRPRRWGAELIPQPCEIHGEADGCKSLDMLITAAAGGNLLARQMLAFDEPAANKVGETLKRRLNVPGVRAVEKPYYRTTHQ